MYNIRSIGCKYELTNLIYYLMTQFRDATRRHRDASLMHARYLSETSKADSELNKVIAEQKQIQVTFDIN